MSVAPPDSAWRRLAEAIRQQREDERQDYWARQRAIMDKKQKQKQKEESAK